MEYIGRRKQRTPHGPSRTSATIQLVRPVRSIYEPERAYTSLNDNLEVVPAGGEDGDEVIDVGVHRLEGPA